MADTQLAVDPQSTAVLQSLQDLSTGAGKLQDALSISAPNTTDAKGKATFDTSKFVSAAYSALTSNVAQMKQQVQQNQQQMQGAVAGEQQAIQTKASADQQAMAVKAASEIQQKADALSSAAMNGVTPGAPGIAISDASAQIQSDLAEYTARDKDMQQRRQTGFLDDPVQWFVNQAVLPYQEKLQQQTEYSMNSQQSAILKAQAITQGSVQIATATDAADAAKQLDAINAGIKAKADQDSADAQARLAQFGQQGIQIRDTLNTTQFSAALQNADFDVKKQELYLQQGYKTIQEQLLGLRVSEKVQTDQDKAALDTGLANLGNFAGVPGLNLQSLKLRPNDQREAIDRMLGYGAMTSGGSLGASAGQVFTDLNTVNAQGGNAGMNYVRGKISDLVTTGINLPMMQQKLGNKQLGQLPASAQADITNQIINSGVAHELAHRPSEGGIYSPGPWKTTLPLINSAAPGLAAAIAPLISANPMAATDPQSLINAQIQRLKSGSITPAIAASELSTSYKAINADIVQQRNLKQLAMRLPSTYNAVVSNGSNFMGFGAKKTVDLASPAALQAFFIRTLIEQNPEVDRLGLNRSK